MLDLIEAGKSWCLFPPIVATCADCIWRPAPMPFGSACSIRASARSTASISIARPCGLFSNHSSEISANIVALPHSKSEDRLTVTLTLRTIIATRTALAKCPSENWPSWLKKMAVIRALSLELSRMRPLTFGNVAQFAVAKLSL